MQNFNARLSDLNTSDISMKQQIHLNNRKSHRKRAESNYKSLHDSLEEIPSEKIDYIDSDHLVSDENRVQKLNVMELIHMNKSDASHLTKSFVNFSQYRTYELKQMRQIQCKKSTVTDFARGSNISSMNPSSKQFQNQPQFRHSMP